ncbi:hypothetical protein [Bifidobacterium choloepi]|uniref:hypothetical protein n=1 Tax=Bifidobacterium choloepi TaxID=2614131 RepID=UPI0013D359CC|nr:hypothetical protein [Bifidobacterium choloepi]
MNRHVSRRRAVPTRTLEQVMGAPAAAMTARTARLLRRTARKAALAKATRRYRVGV